MKKTTKIRIEKFSLKCIASIGIGTVIGEFIGEFCDTTNAPDWVRLVACIAGTTLAAPGVYGVEKLIDEAFEPSMLTACREDSIRCLKQEA